MISDALLLLLLAGGSMLGFFRGPIRQLLAIGAWIVTFVGTAHLRAPLGEWLDASSSELARDYSMLLAFVALYLAVYTAALLLVELGGGAGSSLTRYPLLDDVLGGVLGFVVAVLFVAGAVVALDSYYLVTPQVQPGEFGWLRDIERSLTGSTVTDLLHEWVIRPLGLLLGPLLPPDIRVVME